MDLFVKRLYLIFCNLLDMCVCVCVYTSFWNIMYMVGTAFHNPHIIIQLS